MLILITVRIFVLHEIAHPFWMLCVLLLNAVTFSLFGFIIGMWPTTSRKYRRGSARDPRFLGAVPGGGVVDLQDRVETEILSDSGPSRTLCLLAGMALHSVLLQKAGRRFERQV